VARQEQIILELRNSRSDLESEFRAINSRQTQYEQEMKHVIKKYKSRVKAGTANDEKIGNLEKLNKKLKNENEDMGRQLQRLVEKEEQGTIEKEQISRKREQLLS
jgi:hypothetical protein